MSFTSLIFLFSFLPVAIIAALLLKNNTRLQNIALLLLSLFFYGLGSWRALLILVLLTLWVYAGARTLENASRMQKRISLLITTAGALFFLMVYRYLPSISLFLADHLFSSLPIVSLVLPAGLSFYMFSLLSYFFDVYTGKAAIQKNYGKLLLYAGFFGWVNMGPVQNYETMAPQIDSHPMSRAKVTDGVCLFVQGLFYKCVFADNFALIFSALSGDTSFLAGWFSVLFWFVELYFDFAGYSRMARGLASIFGFDVPVNFNLPFTASSIQDFWRRWHMSLTGWFRRYIYIPLGGNRVKHTRWMINVLIVWILTGIWHGATFNYVFWGLLQGVLILMEHSLDKGLSKIPDWIRTVFVILIEGMSFAAFWSPDFGSLLGLYGRLFGIGISGFGNDQVFFILSQTPLFILAAVFVLFGFSKLVSRFFTALCGKYAGFAMVLCYGLGFLICLVMIVSAASQSFLYAVF